MRLEVEQKPTRSHTVCAFSDVFTALRYYATNSLRERPKKWKFVNKMNFREHRNKQRLGIMLPRIIGHHNGTKTRLTYWPTDTCCAELNITYCLWKRTYSLIVLVLVNDFLQYSTEHIWMLWWLHVGYRWQRLRQYVFLSYQRIWYFYHFSIAINYGEKKVIQLLVLERKKITYFWTCFLQNAVQAIPV